MRIPRIKKPAFCQIILVLLTCCYINSASAYKQSDVREIAPPPGKVSMLRGYSSNTGSLANVCLLNVKESRVKSSVDNEAGNSRFEYITSFEEVMKQKKVDVSVEAKMRFGFGKAQASTDLAFYEKRNSQASSGAMWAYYSDNEAPEFSDPGAKYQLTSDAKALLKKALRRGKPSLFSEFCGDEVVVGYKNGRYIEGFLSTSEMSSMSESEKQIRVEAAVSYMGSSGNAKVEVDGRKFSHREMSNLNIEMRTSGDSKVRNGESLSSFRNAFRDFPTQPKNTTRDLINVYVIDYKDLVAKSEFNLGLKGAQLRKVRAIINGLSTIERALNSAKIDLRIAKQSRGAQVLRAKYGSIASNTQVGGIRTVPKLTLNHLQRELAILKGFLRSNGGCLKPITKKRPWPKECQNLFERFNAFKPLTAFKFKEYMKTAYRSEVNCRAGYPITAPSGKRSCQQCGVAKEPKFLNQSNGQCGYVVNTKAEPGVKRLWAHELKIHDDKMGGEAGIFIEKLSYPDQCKRNGKGCGKARAEQLCKKNGHGKATGFEVWDWRPNNPIHKSKFFTEYANGKRCSSNKDSFTKNNCRTFKYIDCAQQN